METVLAKVKGNGPGNGEAPEGFAPLVGEALYKWQAARIGVELFRSHVAEAETRIREHENGLEAAKMQRAAAIADLNAGRGDLFKVEMEIGIEKPDDVKAIAGKFFRRVNGKAKSDAPAPESAAKVTVTDPAAAGAQAAPPAVEPTPAPAAG